jgi:hypothetical protein
LLQYCLPAIYDFLYSINFYFFSSKILTFIFIILFQAQQEHFRTMYIFEPSEKNYLNTCTILKIIQKINLVTFLNLRTYFLTNEYFLENLEHVFEFVNLFWIYELFKNSMIVFFEPMHNNLNVLNTLSNYVIFFESDNIILESKNIFLKNVNIYFASANLISKFMNILFEYSNLILELMNIF